MAVRTDMAALITRLRRLINDPESQGATWTGLELQEALDLNRVEVRDRELRSVATRSGSNVTYKIFFADCPNWEKDPTLKDNAYESISPTTSDLLTGRFEFASDQNGNMPIFITGYCYDLYGAAVELIENWIAKLRTAVDVTTDDLSLKRSQQVSNLETLLEQYRQRTGQWSGVAAAQMAEDGVGEGRFVQTDFNVGCY